MDPVLARKKADNIRAAGRTSMRKVPSSADSMDTREKLIHAAKVLFAEKGFEGATVKEIADFAHVNVSLVSYHFGGKENLYCVCLEHFGQARLVMSERTLQEASSLDELKVRLQLFIENIFNTHLEDPEVTVMLMRECDQQSPIAKDVFKRTFLKVYQNLVSFFRMAQKKDLLRKNIDVESLASLLFGGVIQVLQKDGISREFFGRTIADPKYRETLIQDFISLCFFGCVKATGIRPEK